MSKSQRVAPLWRPRLLRSRSETTIAITSVRHRREAYCICRSAGAVAATPYLGNEEMSLSQRNATIRQPLDINRHNTSMNFVQLFEGLDFPAGKPQSPESAELFEAADHPSAPEFS